MITKNDLFEIFVIFFLNTSLLSRRMFFSGLMIRILFRTYVIKIKRITHFYAKRNPFVSILMHYTSWGYMGFLTLSLAGCTSDRDCPLTEACIGHTCQEPCLVRNPCAEHAVCINTNHGADCSCEEGYHGNGFSYCDLRKFYNEMSNLYCNALQCIKIT